MRGGQGTRRRRARGRPALVRVSGRIGGSRTVLACITRRGRRDAVDPQRVHYIDLRIRHSQAAAQQNSKYSRLRPTDLNPRISHHGSIDRERQQVGVTWILT
jgi:hypothetical protein